MKVSLVEQLAWCRQASNNLRIRPDTDRRALVLGMAAAIETAQASILDANRVDVIASIENGLSSTLVDRLTLSVSKLISMVEDMRRVATLPDPLGVIDIQEVRPSGLSISRVSVPLGVVGVIYESRPNVTTDIAALCIRSGNGVILRGGSETLTTNHALVLAMQGGMMDAQNALQFIDSPDRELIKQIICSDALIDVIIPRGGRELSQFCVKNATVPVIVGGAGVCHLYMDKTVRIQEAIAVILNAKTQRTSVCNALDTVLVHKERWLDAGVPLCNALVAKGVSLRVCASLLADLKHLGGAVCQSAKIDLGTEWLALTCNVVVVPALEDAAEHIAVYGSHSDGILSDDPEAIARFVTLVDSPAVFINASTRFHDGGEFGLGAEVAVSTQKVHARGPLGLASLTSSKWIATGNYLSRE